MSMKKRNRSLTDYLYTKAAIKGVPLSGTFELTPVCNMSCRMCYVRMTREQQEKIRPLRRAEDWLELGQIAKDKGLLYLLLTGGEPLLHPDFRKIMEGLHRLGLIISINTNGTLINEETVEWLKRCPPSRVNITVYGASDKTYERLCGNPRGYTQVVHALHLLKEAGIHVRLNCSVTPYNREDLKGIFALGKSLDTKVNATAYMFPPMRRDASMIGRNHRFTPKEAARTTAYIEYLSNGKERFLRHTKEGNYDGLREDAEDNCEVLEGEGMRCRAGRCSYWITWDGRMLPCGMFPGEDNVNVFDTGFDYACKKTREETAAIRLPAKCAACSKKERCHACAAMVYTESGTYSEVPKYRCEMSEHYVTEVQELANRLENEEYSD